MQQRTYQGNISAEEMADFLVQHYAHDQGLPKNMTALIQHDIQAQKVGEGQSFLVQIGHGKDPGQMRHIALTVAIGSAPNGPPGVVVAMGQRHWITPDELKNAALWVVLGVLFSPFALFGLLWPLSDIYSDSTLPNDIWDTVDVYAAGQGATLLETQTLEHPHLGVKTAMVLLVACQMSHSLDQCDDAAVPAFAMDAYASRVCADFRALF